MTTINTISAADAAFLLRRELGPRNNWYEFLHDARRRDAFVAGYTLLPSCRMHDGTAFRPRYSLDAVWEFINKLKAAGAASADPTAIDVVALDLDGRRKAWAWRDQRHDRTGQRIKPKRLHHSAVTEPAH
ncbi:hypothetical protein ACFQ4M_12070 [Thauera mechernichensis]|uniref:Uncharacterized protein n=1 Tax=Thauera mechernichensis TaxID=82788 RepID=A0ABW3WHA2_9RHOO|nr:hypothetical protein [Thauera mechernichensis]MDG3063892.1 hypothetical protein [Thauera mechernichensis]